MWKYLSFVQWDTFNKKCYKSECHSDIGSNMKIKTFHRHIYVYLQSQAFHDAITAFILPVLGIITMNMNTEFQFEQTKLYKCLF